METSWTSRCVQGRGFDYITVLDLAVCKLTRKQAFLCWRNTLKCLWFSAAPCGEQVYCALLSTCPKAFPYNLGGAQIYDYIGYSAYRYQRIPSRRSVIFEKKRHTFVEPFSRSKKDDRKAPFCFPYIVMKLKCRKELVELRVAMRIVIWSQGGVWCSSKFL